MREKILVAHLNIGKSGDKYKVGLRRYQSHGNTNITREELTALGKEGHSLKIVIDMKNKNFSKFNVSMLDKYKSLIKFTIFHKP